MKQVAKMFNFSLEEDIREKFGLHLILLLTC